MVSTNARVSEIYANNKIDTAEAMIVMENARYLAASWRTSTIARTIIAEKIIQGKQSIKMLLTPPSQTYCKA